MRDKNTPGERSCAADQAAGFLICDNFLLFYYNVYYINPSHFFRATPDLWFVQTISYKYGLDEKKTCLSLSKGTRKVHIFFIVNSTAARWGEERKF